MGREGGREKKHGKMAKTLTLLNMRDRYMGVQGILFTFGNVSNFLVTNIVCEFFIESALFSPCALRFFPGSQGLVGLALWYVVG